MDQGRAPGQFAASLFGRPGSLAAAALAAAFAAASCRDPSLRNQPAPAAELLAAKVTADEVLAWRYRQAAAADLDGDGRDETVIVAADVEASGKGRFLWEDGHRWAVVVTDGAASNTLAYSAFVPRGFVEAAVLRPSAEGRREILVQERTPERLRSITIAYDGPGRARAASAAYYQVESWVPGSARLHE